MPCNLILWRTQGGNILGWGKFPIAFIVMIRKTPFTVQVWWRQKCNSFYYEGKNFYYLDKNARDKRRHRTFVLMYLLSQKSIAVIRNWIQILPKRHNYRLQFQEVRFITGLIRNWSPGTTKSLTELNKKKKTAISKWIMYICFNSYVTFEVRAMKTATLLSYRFQTNLPFIVLNICLSLELN